MKNTKLKIILAFLCVYVIWGSTYLAIRFAIQTIPPFSMVAIRFLAAGLLLLCFGKRSVFSTDQIFAAMVSGILFFSLGNGLITLAEKEVPSAVAAGFAASVPIWVQLFNWGWFERKKPQGVALAGGFLGLFGVIGLTNGQMSLGTHQVSVLALMIGVLCWSLGSLVQRTYCKDLSPFQLSGYQMISGSVGLFFLAWMNAEFSTPFLSQVTRASVAGLIYLITAGSVIGFSAYSYLNQRLDPGIVNSYALVNPLVAIILGYFIGNEKLDSTLLVSTGFIISGLGLLFLPKRVVSPSESRPPRFETLRRWIRYEATP